MECAPDCQCSSCLAQRRLQEVFAIMNKTIEETVDPRTLYETKLEQAKSVDVAAAKHLPYNPNFFLPGNFQRYNSRLTPV